MKIEFDWKNFENDRPEIGKKIIVKWYESNLVNKGWLWIGEFHGSTGEEDKEVLHFSGKEFFPKNLRMYKTLAYPIYSKNQYINNFNPFDFLWDYYNDDWG